MLGTNSDQKEDAEHVISFHRNFLAWRTNISSIRFPVDHMIHTVAGWMIGSCPNLKVQGDFYLLQVQNPSVGNVTDSNNISFSSFLTNNNPGPQNSF